MNRFRIRADNFQKMADEVKTLRAIREYLIDMVVDLTAERDWLREKNKFAEVLLRLTSENLDKTKAERAKIQEEYNKLLAAYQDVNEKRKAGARARMDLVKEDKHGW